jgi:hypothetical protein
MRCVTSCCPNTKSHSPVPGQLPCAVRDLGYGSGRGVCRGRCLGGGKSDGGAGSGASLTSADDTREPWGGACVGFRAEGAGLGGHDSNHGQTWRGGSPHPERVAEGGTEGGGAPPSSCSPPICLACPASIQRCIHPPPHPAHRDSTRQKRESAQGCRGRSSLGVLQERGGSYHLPVLVVRGEGGRLLLALC